MFGITRAPEIDRPGLVWFNVERPLSLADLRGRIVVLDFWTFCCINCIHVLPTLHRLEQAFPGEVAVIGVHSPKFAAERDPAAVRDAILRYGIRHPVVHDPAMTLWDEYGVRAWPTLVFLSPDGHVIGQTSGEPDPRLLVDGVDEMVRQLAERGEIRPGILALRPETVASGRLRFPGKIKPVPDPEGRKLWAVADAGHHQIVVADDHGTELERFGAGQAGFRDGAAAEALFSAPQGLACDSVSIYVADTGNHALRRIDRASGKVVTLAGLGLRGPALRRPGPGPGTALASPWDVALDGRLLYFANAGTHQIGVLDLDGLEVRAVAGSGGEDIADGPAARALLAQPSGLALDPAGPALWFADSETSAIRRLRLDGAPVVETAVGRGLFDFGHRNGAFDRALLQHPLGLAVTPRGVVVADSYNGRLRLLDFAAMTVSDLGEDLACGDPVCRPLSEPAGVAADGCDRLLVSDTNNHRIVELDLGRKVMCTWME